MLIDVRSPSEYAKGHIPSAKNIPLFSDEERAEVGTLYKQVGQQEAFDLGLKYVGGKLADFVAQARTYNQNLQLYCWRGGMRSQSMGWLFKTAGIECTIKEGGYKIYRQWVLQFLQQNFSFKVLTGLTGSGKTEKLQNLKQNGESVLDLEGLANHRGSSFGMLGQKNQPSNEHFENLLADHLSKLSSPIWVEDESRMIGNCKIPDSIYAAMQQGEIVQISASKKQRVQRLITMYAHFPEKELLAATDRLHKKLGSERTMAAKQAIVQGNFIDAVELILQYYDKAYESFSRKRSSCSCD